jgi:hypothetical protein
MRAHQTLLITSVLVAGSSSLACRLDTAASVTSDGTDCGRGDGAPLVMPPSAGSSSSGTMLVNEQSVREVAVFLRTALRFEMPAGDPLSVFAALTLDFFPLQDRLLVRQSGAARAVFTPWPLRPGALAGASLAF